MPSPVVDAHGADTFVNDANASIPLQLSGTNRLLLVAVPTRLIPTITGLTFAGVNLTEVPNSKSTRGAVVEVTWFYLFAPSTAAGQSVALTFSANAYGRVGAIAFRDAPQTLADALRTPVLGSGFNGTSVGPAVASAADEVVVTAISAKEAAAGSQVTLPSGASAIGNTGVSTTTGAVGSQGTAYITGAASTAATWENPGNADWSTSSIAVKGITADTTPPAQATGVAASFPSAGTLRVVGTTPANDVTHYRVRRKAGTGQTFTGPTDGEEHKAETAIAVSTSFTADAAAAGSSYTVCVFLRDAAGNYNTGVTAEATAPSQLQAQLPAGAQLTGEVTFDSDLAVRITPGFQVQGTTSSSNIKRRRWGTVDRRAVHTVRMRPPDGRWVQLGTGEGRGLVAEQLSLTVDPSGPTTASFNLRREGRAQHPDLAPGTEVEVEVNGRLLWSGRVDTTPGEDRSLAVSCRGWQYHLDDDLFQRSYVKADMAEWRDARSYLETNLAAHIAAGQVSNDRGALSLGFPNGAVIGGNQLARVVLDMGHQTTATRIVAVVSRTGPWDSSTHFIARGGPDPGGAAANDAFDVLPFNQVDGAPGTTTLSGTFPTASRYVSLIVQYIGAGGTYTADQILRVAAVRVFSDAAYESGGASVLRAPQVIAYAANAKVPMLTLGEVDPDGLATVNIPSLSLNDYMTPRQHMEAANALYNWHLGVGADRRIFFRPRPSLPAVQIGSWPGSRLSGLSLGSLEDVFSRVIVQGTGPGGEALTAVRTMPSPLDALGYRRTQRLTVDSAATQSILEVIGDVWLAEKSRTPFRGSVAITGTGGARSLQGGDLHPSELLQHAGGRLRITDLVDPDTGAVGRDAQIASVSYTADDEQASVALDSQHDRLETLLARFGVFSAAAA